jgi:hypothetical protein
MYFKESSQLIDDNILDKDLIRGLDRELARAFAPEGTGFIEQSRLAYRSNASFADVARLMSLYEAVGVVSCSNKIICPLDHLFRPGDKECPECGRDISEATVSDEKAYAILKQPDDPWFDPDTASTQPGVFISYRSGDTARLAADIYYSLQAEEYEVFLDAGAIPPSADAERQFLTAASNAANFIALVSQNYFASSFCKREIAHAARCRRRLIRVNIAPVPAPPKDMPWIDDGNWVRQAGESSGLTPQLDKMLLAAVRTPATDTTIADKRYQACQFLLSQMTTKLELLEVWNRLEWLKSIDVANNPPAIVRQILKNTPESKLDLLCAALGP